MKEEPDVEMDASQESNDSINSELEKKTLIMGEPSSEAEFASPGGSDDESDENADSQRPGAWMGRAYKALASETERQDTVVDIEKLLDCCKDAKNGRPLPDECVIFKLEDLWCFGLRSEDVSGKSFMTNAFQMIQIFLMVSNGFARPI